MKLTKHPKCGGYYLIYRNRCGYTPFVGTATYLDGGFKVFDLLVNNDLRGQIKGVTNLGPHRKTNICHDVPDYIFELSNEEVALYILADRM